MSKILKFTVLICMLSAANAWGVGFKDDFNRANGAVGNGWTIETNGTIKVEIVDNEVFISGTEGSSAWDRAGIVRPVSGETRVSFDFKADDVFNVHIHVESAGSPAWIEFYAWEGGPFSYANSTDGSWPAGPWTAIPGSDMVAGQYNTLVVEKVGVNFILTLNGKVVGTVPNAAFTTIESVELASDADAGQTGSLHIDNVLIGKVIAGKAKEPSPADGATGILRDAAIGWTAGEYAGTHNVYLGTSFDDVNAADISKAVSKGQTETTFQPAGLLGYGTTYYWRIDEVNAPPTNVVFKGDVWSFTTEAYSYPITSVTATASSSAKDMGPEKTVDGSGLDAATGVHDGVSTNMWLSAAKTPLPAWISYAFDQPYIIREMKVWNSNQKTIEPWVGFGAKSVLIEYSLDGTAWTASDTVEFAQADGSDTYAGFTIPMHDVEAKFVRLTINSGWGNNAITGVGLSEVRFQYIPVKARQPSPAAGAIGVPLDTAFDWREGRLSASHKVYFNTDKAKVVDGTALVTTTTDHSYQPPSLNFGTLYYWKVDEVNSAPASNYPGDIWSFATAEFTDIDNFESYTNESPNRVFQTWIDGWGFSKDDNFPDGNPGNGTGALVGYDPSVGDIMETSITHGGGQAMPVEYNNVDSPYYSEVDRTWSSGQNWTANGATELSLWFRGNPAELDQSTNGHLVISSYGGDIWGSSDYFCFVYKKLTGDGTITAKVNSQTYAADWSKAGVMIRESLDPGSSYGIMAVTPSRIRAFQNRPTTGGSAFSAHSATNTITLPFWVKLEKKGNQITASYSTNGTTWTVQPATENTGTDASPNPQTITMGSSVYIGLAVSANTPSTGACVADFSDVVTSSSVTGTWTAADIGGVNPANGPDQIYVTLTDSANKSKTVVYPNPKATCLADWTQWRIPFKDLSPVNAAAIKKMAIGVGSSSSPKGGAAGKLYIDDIQYGTGIPDLVASYAFENDAKDGSGNGNDGTLVGGPTFVAGKTGQAVQFPGTQGNYVDLGTLNPSALTGKLSISLWANWKGVTGQYQGLVAKRNWWDNAQMMWQVEANNTTGNVTFSRNGSYPGSGNPILPVGQWAHVAVTFDGTTARFYVNGVQTGSGAFSFGANPDASAHIGCCDSNGGNPFNGAIDEVRLYNRALSAAEVSALAK